MVRSYIWFKDGKPSGIWHAYCILHRRAVDLLHVCSDFESVAKDDEPCCIMCKFCRIRVIAPVEDLKAVFGGDARHDAHV